MQALTWSLRLGENAGWLAKISREQGKQFASLVDAPSLTLYEDFYFQAFQELTGSRINGGFGASPIMLTEILAYTDLHGLSEMDDRIEFVRLIQLMDGAFMAHMNKKESGSHV